MGGRICSGESLKPCLAYWHQMLHSFVASCLADGNVFFYCSQDCVLIYFSSCSPDRSADSWTTIPYLGWCILISSPKWYNYFPKGTSQKYWRWFTHCSGPVFKLFSLSSLQFTLHISTQHSCLHVCVFVHMFVSETLCMQRRDCALQCSWFSAYW